MPRPLSEEPELTNLEGIHARIHPRGYLLLTTNQPDAAIRLKELTEDLSLAHFIKDKNGADLRIPL